MEGPRGPSSFIIKSMKLAVVLHNIRSLHNVGSIFRTADAVGAEKIYLCGITPGPMDRFGREEKAFTKVSLGAEKSVPFEKARRTSDAIKKLKKEGYTILALEQSRRSAPYHKFRSKKTKLALILGAEVRGLPAGVLKQADKILEIPMFGKKESLNVAVAFGIAAYRLALDSRLKR